MDDVYQKLVTYREKGTPAEQKAQTSAVNECKRTVSILHTTAFLGTPNFQILKVRKTKRNPSRDLRT